MLKCEIKIGCAMYPSINLIINTQEMPFLIELLFFPISILNILFQIIVFFYLIFYVNKRGFFLFLE